ncbi:MAG: GNAT family N-acetyltransferase [Propionibacteriaceae bacterium]|nr:GNAT family N-acetyltransferase [Propionibacteriaceae bacterium]
MALKIRRARADDLAAIAQIYNEAGVQTTASYDTEPVSLESRTAWLKLHEVRDHPVLVLVRDEEVVGYAEYDSFRDKAGYAHTVEHTIYVREGHRSAGGGRMLMAALIDHARGQQVHTMVGFIDSANTDSIEFHRSLGFSEVGRMPQAGRKFGSWLDLVIVQRILG